MSQKLINIKKIKNTINIKEKVYSIFYIATDYNINFVLDIFYKNNETEQGYYLSIRNENDKIIDFNYKYDTIAFAYGNYTTNNLIEYAFKISENIGNKKIQNIIKTFIKDMENENELQSNE